MSIDAPFLPLFEEERPEMVWPDRGRYLLSYAYVNEKDMEAARRNGLDLIVDSGAFTTAASGKQMDHPAYLEWLLANADAITFALSYDVIGDHEASRANHERALEVIGDAVLMVPTWHLGSPLAEFERLCELYPYVSVGGAVPFAKEPAYLSAIASRVHAIARHTDTQLHGLGMTGRRILHAHPWTSVDSSSWLTGVRFPAIPLASRDGGIVMIEHGQYLDNFARELVRQYGGDPDIMTEKGWSLKAHVGSEVALQRREWIVIASARAFMYQEAYKNAHQPDNPIRLYLSGISSLPVGAAETVAMAHALGDPWAGPTPEVKW